MEFKQFIDESKEHLKDKKVTYRLIIIAMIILGILGYRYFVYHFTYSSYAFVHANTVNIHSQVPGTLTKIFVKNNQRVNQGELLVQLDPRPYQYALERAKAERDISINDDPRGTLQPLLLNDALLKRANAELELSQYNYEQTSITAPTNGVITNVELTRGDYLQKGQGLFALIDTEHWWVITRYRETVLRKIHVGDKVKIMIDMYPWKIFNGVVESIDWGINREETSPQAAPSTLPYIQPTEYWIRLSQRYPVWIQILDVDKEHPLRVGSNARTFVISNSHG